MTQAAPVSSDIKEYSLNKSVINCNVINYGGFMDLRNSIKQYLNTCSQRSNLNGKTIKAYRLDLEQFGKTAHTQSAECISRSDIETYVTDLQSRCKPASIKRKIAVLRVFFRFMEDEYGIENPFARTRFKIREPVPLPKTIPLYKIERLLTALYKKRLSQKKESRQYGELLRDVTVLELLFATGIRVSELCGLTARNIDLTEGIIKISGKGGKMRFVHVCDRNVLRLLSDYSLRFSKPIAQTGFFFINRTGAPLLPASVRLMLRRWAKEADIDLHITPHMFRHSFATLLLEADVDIRYIQQFLGHSSITTTQIYTHVTSAKQRSILAEKHPRNKLNIRTE
jgi:integrase/recombinase XerD